MFCCPIFDMLLKTYFEIEEKKHFSLLFRFYGKPLGIFERVIKISF